MQPLWRNRDYRLLWTGNLVSSVGSATVLIALPLLIIALTGKPLQAGGVAATETIPYIVLSLPTGILVDRYSRRTLLIAAASVATLVSTVIPVAYLTHHLSIGLIYGVAVVLGGTNALNQIAQVAVLPKLVTEDQLGTASGQAEVIFNLSAMTGPPLAGLLLSAGHLALPFIVDAASFGVLALAVGLIRTRLDAAKPAPAGSWRAELTGGFRTLLRHRPLRALSLITLTGDFLFSGITVLMTLLAKSRGGSPATIGAVFAIAAFGGVAGSLLAARFQGGSGLVRAVMMRSWMAVLLFPLLATGLPVLVLGVVWGLLNVMIAYMNVTQVRLTVQLAPEEVLGRTQSAVTFASFAVLPAGALFTGILLQAAGPRGTVLVWTGVLALIAVYSSVSKDLRAPLQPRSLTGSATTTLLA